MSWMPWVTQFELDSIIEELKSLLKESSVDEGHGIDHALTVMHHCVKAVEEMKPNDRAEFENNFMPNVTIQPTECDAVILAGLLHDADDAKFFKSNGNPNGECDYKNARHLLRDFPPHFVRLVVEMISLVSCSKNRNNIPDYIEKSFQDYYTSLKWMLIPRWADRLESTGQIGLDRAIIYTKVIERPFHTSDTKKATNLAELYEIATPQRFNTYKGVSDSVIDHLYDKVLHLKVKTGIKYFDDIFEERHKVVEDFILDYWRSH